MLTAVAPAPDEAARMPAVARPRFPARRWPMIRAIVLKELRSLAPLAVLAGLIELYLVCILIGLPLPFFRRAEETIPFVADPYCWWVLAVAGIFGAVAGLWQTLWESARGTYQFLLHRPLERHWLFAAKLATGALLTWLMAGVPLLLYALWAATPGTHAGPFEWSMSRWAWDAWLALPLFYLGGFLSGLRSARIFGSRLWPLAGTAVLFPIVVLLSLAWSPGLAPVVCGAAAAFTLGAIFWVARTRDFS
ncbi:MAG: hypothetical protein JNG90_14325 [Planctomycetaceae bacterium]|nr:hypothetical protein [Planctomycetaceae bacterium]